MCVQRREKTERERGCSSVLLVHRGGGGSRGASSDVGPHRPLLPPPLPPLLVPLEPPPLLLGSMRETTRCAGVYQAVVLSAAGCWSAAATAKVACANYWEGAWLCDWD